MNRRGHERKFVASINSTKEKAMHRLTEVDNVLFMEHPFIPQEIKDYVKEGVLVVQYNTDLDLFDIFDTDGNLSIFYLANW